jgi:hypothetical protein
MKVTKEPLHYKYKSKECVQFHGAKFCPYGVRCMFMHEERSLDQIKDYHFVYKLDRLIEDSRLEDSDVF